MKKKMQRIISATAALCICAGFAPVILGAENTDTLEIESLKTYGSNFEFKFSEAVTQETAQKYISVVAGGVTVPATVTVDAEDATKVTARIDEASALKGGMVTVGSDMTAENGAEIIHPYYAEFSVNGYFEDFGEGYQAGDWKWRSSLENKGDSTSGDAIVRDGELYMIDYDNETGDQLLTTYSMFAAPSDMASYSYVDSFLEYDYTKTQDVNNECFAVAMRGNVSSNQYKEEFFGAWGNTYANGASYVFQSVYSGFLFATPQAGKTVGWNYTTVSEKNGWTRTVGQKYRYRVTTANIDTDADGIDDSVQIDVYRGTYTDGGLGDITHYYTYVDSGVKAEDGTYTREPVLDAGVMAFAAKAGTGHKIDNVIFTDVHELELKDATMKLTGVKASEGNIVAEFSQEVQSADGVVLFDADMNEYAAEKSVSGNSVIIKIPEADWGKSFTLVARKGIPSSAGDTMGKTYTAEISNLGFYDDFGADYQAGDWKHYPMGASVRNATVSNEMLYVTGNYGATNPTDAFIYKNNYTDYLYKNSVLEYDYIRSVDSDNAWNHQFWTLLKQDSGSFNYTSWQMYASKGYGIYVDWNGNSKLGQFTDTQLKEKSGTDKLTNKTVTAGTPYRYRIETVTGEDSVSITVKRAEYANGELSDYTTLGTVTDTSSPDLTAGSFAFALYRTAPDYIIDNISYTSGDSFEIVDYSTTVDAVKAEIDRIFAEENWNLYKEEIAQIGEDIAAVEKIAGTFDADYKAKYEQLVNGKSISEINKGFFEQYEGRDSLTIGFIGGSLTEGGKAYQEIFKNYMSEKTGIAADSIKVVNAGNGGQTSNWVNMRLYDDIMAHNPDIVVFDFAGNDDVYSGSDYTRYINGYLGTVNFAETAIRRIMKMENSPTVILNEIPALDRMLKQALRNEGAEYYLTASGTIEEITMPAYKAHIELAEYYNIPCINIIDYVMEYMTINTKVTNEDSTTTITPGVEYAYYTFKSDISTGKIVWTEATADTLGAVKVCTTPYNQIVEDIDYTALQESLGKTYILNEGYGNTFRTIAKDNVHPTTTAEGYSMYGDIMVKLMEEDAKAALRLESLPEEPYSTPTYDQFTPKKIVVTKANLDAMENVTITGEGSYEDINSFETTNLRKKSGVQFTGPLTVTYNFKGHVLYLAGSDNTTLYKYGLIDGMAYPNEDYMINQAMLKNDTDHTLVLDIPEGTTYSLAEIYVDEETLNYNFTTPKDKYTTVDLTYYANAYGLFREGDAPVYSMSGWDSEVDSTLGKHGMLLYGSDEAGSIGKNIPLANDVKGYFEGSEYTGEVPYDMSMLGNYRSKAVTLKASLVSRLYGQWRKLSVGDSGNAEIEKLRIDVADDYYSSVNILARATSAKDITVYMYYTDGTYDSTTLNVSNGTTLYTGNSYNRLTGAKTTSTYTVNEIELPVANQAKKLDYIKFANAATNACQIYAMTLENVYDAAVMDVEFEDSEGKTIYDLTAHKGENVKVNITAKANVTAGAEGKAYVTFYDGNVLKSVQTVDIKTTGIDTVDADISVPADYDSNYTTKVLFWNGMTPYTLAF